MGDHEKESTVDVPWFKKFEGREVAVVRGLISAVVAIGLIWGVDLTAVGDQLSNTADVLGTMVMLLSPLWIRGGVSPASEVVAKQLPDGTVVAGAALAQGFSVTVTPIV